MAPALRESVTWSAPELTPTTAQDEINTSLAYGFGFDFCGIEIDRDTGEIRVDKYVTSHDCGTILNPGLADGEIHGSFAAAIGASLYEEFVYGEDGSFLSGTFADIWSPARRKCRSLTCCTLFRRPHLLPALAPKELQKATNTARQFASPTPSPMRLGAATSWCR